MKAGEEAAYRMFYEAYFTRLSRYLIVVAAGDEDAAREALQATLKRVVRYVRVFAAEEVFWSWLTTLARSAFADERRKRRRYFAFLGRFAREAEIEAEGAAQADDRLHDLLTSSIAQLGAAERQLLQWKYTERRPVAAIAGLLGATEKMVESRLTRVRLKLKESILRGLKNERA
jgi:RNA polymerase sigma-70 factor (ECF subfamily)